MKWDKAVSEFSQTVCEIRKCREYKVFGLPSILREYLAHIFRKVRFSHVTHAHFTLKKRKSRLSHTHIHNIL